VLVLEVVENGRGQIVQICRVLEALGLSRISSSAPKSGISAMAAIFWELSLSGRCCFSFHFPHPFLRDDIAPFNA